MLYFSGNCPKGSWINFQSRCYYHWYRDWKTLSAAKSTCAQRGGHLISQITTKAQRDFVLIHVIGNINIAGHALWTGIVDKHYALKFHEGTYRVKLCGRNTSLFYHELSWRPLPDCSASHLVTCEVRKGKHRCHDINVKCYHH